MEIQTPYREQFPEPEPPETKPPEHIEQCINNVVKNEGYITHTVTWKEIPIDGGNYLAQLYEVAIKGLTKNGEKELEIFVKNVVPVGDGLQFFSITDVYSNECFFYKEVANAFAILEEEANVPMNERFKCAKGYHESTTEAILLENLAKKGFHVHNRMKTIPLKYFELSLDQLAKIHAITFVLEEKMPDMFKKIQQKRTPVTYNQSWYDFMNSMAKMTLNNLGEDVRKKAEAMLPEFLDHFKEYYQDDSLQVFCHGDFRAGNILIREEEGEIQEAVPVDYQIIHYGNPANDLVYFLYGCNDKSFRQRHSKYLIDFYYSSMKRYLGYFDIDIYDVYPRSKLDHAIARRYDFSAVVAICYYPFFYAPKDNAPTVKDLGEKADMVMDVDVEIVKRIEEILEGLERPGRCAKSSLSVWG